MKKRVIITGVSGLIGSRLALLLSSKGYDVVGLTRSPERHTWLANSGVRLIRWNGSCPDSWFRQADGALAVINLAGENISEGRWTAIRRQHILDTRIMTIHAVQDALSLIDNPPELFIQASAIGYYGTSTEAGVTESHPSGNGFLASVCRRFETEALLTERTKVLLLRFGVVLEKDGGALGKIIAPMRWGIGGYPAPGRNMVSWIHMDDLVRGMLHLLQLQDHRQVYNMVSPNPVRLRQLVCTAARQKKVPVCIPVPGHFIKALFGGQMVEETILADQSVVPEALASSGFTFRHPFVEAALEDLFS